MLSTLGTQLLISDRFPGTTVSIIGEWLLLVGAGSRSVPKRVLPPPLESDMREF